MLKGDMLVKDADAGNIELFKGIGGMRSVV